MFYLRPCRNTLRSKVLLKVTKVWRGRSFPLVEQTNKQTCDFVVYLIWIPAAVLVTLVRMFWKNHHLHLVSPRRRRYFYELTCNPKNVQRTFPCTAVWSTVCFYNQVNTTTTVEQRFPTTRVNTSCCRCFVSSAPLILTPRDLSPLAPPPDHWPSSGPAPASPNFFKRWLLAVNQRSAQPHTSANELLISDNRLHYGNDLISTALELK